jgi:tetratricopeptide (TPR) repeat protein
MPKSSLRQDACLGIADSYFQEGDFAKARAHYQRFIGDFPQSQFLSLVYLRLGQIDLKQGRWKEAADLFLKIKRDYPLSFEADTAQRLLTGDNFFTVQVASFQDLEKAKALSIKLINKSYPEVFISSLDKEGQTFYRVRMGKFNTQKEALALKDRLTKEGYKPIIYP